MIVNVVAGSPKLNINTVKKYKADMTVGVDFGAYKLIESGQKIDAAFGDFDSVSTDQFVKVLNGCPSVHKYNCDKDKSDTELALEYAAELNPEEINLFGVTGKRIDHFFGVLNLYHTFLNKDCRLNIIDDNNKIYLLKPGTHTIKKQRFKYISFFSYNGAVEKLTLQGFKYNLENHLLDNANSLCISNEIENGYGIVNFSHGYLLIVESND